MQQRQSLTKTILAVAAALAISVGLAPRYLPTVAAAEANLAAEASTLNAFGNDLLALDKQCATLDKKATLTRAEFNAVQASADKLKQRTATAQQAFRSIIEKLKAANQWNEFDSIALQKSKKERIQSFLRSEGGAKRILENAAAQLSSLASEIDAPLNRLRSKVREQTGSIGVSRDERGLSGPLLRASFSASASLVNAPAAPVAAARSKCFFAKARSFVSGLVNGGTPSSDAINAECKACGVAFEDCPDPNL